MEARALAPDERLHAPHLLDVEVTQALRRLTQLKEITPARAQEALGDHAALLVKRAPHYDMLPRIGNSNRLCGASLRVMALC